MIFLTSDYCFCKQHALQCKSHDAFLVSIGIEKSVRFLGSIDRLLLTVEGVTPFQVQEKKQSMSISFQVVDLSIQIPDFRHLINNYCKPDRLFSFPTTFCYSNLALEHPLFVYYRYTLYAAFRLLLEVGISSQKRKASFVDALRKDPLVQCHNCPTPCVSLPSDQIWFAGTSQNLYTIFP